MRFQASALLFTLECEIGVKSQSITSDLVQPSLDKLRILVRLKLLLSKFIERR
jgi:hypothetical protein